MNQVQSQRIHKATITPARAISPAATEPTFFVAAPVKLSAEDPVCPAVAGAIGEPVAAGEPYPDPFPEPVAVVPDLPVPAAAPLAVPVAKPEEAVELKTLLAFL